MGDTIAAISTAQGEGGIGIVRVSGPKALEIMKTVFTPYPEEVRGRYAYYGHVFDPKSGERIDEGLAIYMPAPHTYTCEDVLELQVHGGVFSLRKVLRAVLRAGARMAEPGEFTKLAFLNGRIDLTQAEAVIDIIRARSEAPLVIAEEQLEGRLGTEVIRIRNDLLDVLSRMAVNIDFPDEDIEQVAYEEFILELRRCQERTEALLLTADEGRIAREGIRLAIVGKPNVGKSSLLNGLLKEKRAIVTDIPGTTRDTIEESASIGGFPVILTDTAGIRETGDAVERIGIERSQEELRRADVVLFVLDGSRALEKEDFDIIGQIQDHPVIAVLNKKDLGKAIHKEEIRKLLPEASIVRTSLQEADGADEVAGMIREKLFGGIESREHAVISNERQQHALERAMEAITSAIVLLEKGEALEICEIEAHQAYEDLGEIIGETAGEEIIDNVFSKFCLGK